LATTGAANAVANASALSITELLRKNAKGFISNSFPAEDHLLAKAGERRLVPACGNAPGSMLGSRKRAQISERQMRMTSVEDAKNRPVSGAGAAYLAIVDQRLLS
jgi:hypothetical protein